VSLFQTNKPPVFLVVDASFFSVPPVPSVPSVRPVPPMPRWMVFGLRGHCAALLRRIFSAEMTGRMVIPTTVAMRRSLAERGAVLKMVCMKGA